jgi:hypothetical protein
LLLVTIHHIVADGWSIEVFMHELQALYGAYHAGMASPLAPLAIQYSDFAIWQRNVMQGERLQSEVDFWKGHLAGLPTLVTLPTDRPRPPVQSSRGFEYRFALSRELPEDLKRREPSGRPDAVHDADDGVRNPPAPLRRPGTVHRQYPASRTAPSRSWNRSSAA